MQKCPKCGSSNSDKAIYCDQCSKILPKTKGGVSFIGGLIILGIFVLVSQLDKCKKHNDSKNKTSTEIIQKNNKSKKKKNDTLKISKKEHKISEDIKDTIQSLENTVIDTTQNEN